MTYEEYLKQKKITTESTGFECQNRNPKLFDWQNDVALWAIRKGRAGIFSDCGLGKTAIQLWWAQQITEHEHRPVLILAPLAVAQQTKREGDKFGVPVTVCRTQADVRDGVNITNYEMMNHFDADAFCGVVLDESGILKAYMGKTKRALIRMWENTQYKLVCTATPSPNDQMEILNQAEYLGVMKSNEALAIWFIADQSAMGTYRLKRHGIESFWDWCATWCVCFQKPSDLSSRYSDDGYDLPPLNEHDVVLPIDELDETFTDGLVRNIQTSATGFHKEKRVTLKQRCAKCKEIADGIDGQVLIWCFTNDEADELKRIMPDATEIRGSDSVEVKEKAVEDFASGKIRVLISKSSIFGFGINWQNCCNAIFCGMDYSYEGYYQAVRRLYRFGQQNPVNCYLVIGSTEQNILNTIREKQRLQDVMHQGIVSAMIRRNEVGERKYFKKYKQENRTVDVPEWLRSEVP